MFVPIILSFQIIFVQTLRFQKPVTEKIWSVRCKKNEHVLNDCNWCWCGQNYHFQCKARVCEEVDMFGHFKDTIQEVDVGMEGHGAWRSRATPCIPGVKYQRGNLLCICDGDGNWPNPVCRDIFRILHSVEVTENVEESTSQTCTPTKLYLVACNTCFCPSSGKLDEKLCTNRTCSDGDPVLESKDIEASKTDISIAGDNGPNSVEFLTEPKDDNAPNTNRHGESINDDDKDIDDDAEPQNRLHTVTFVETNRKELEIYGTCNINKTYTIYHQVCKCLTNNRLICKDSYDNSSRETKLESSSCSGRLEYVFNKQCNICKCTKRGYMYCTTRNCIPREKGLSLVLRKVPRSQKMVKAPIDDLECVAGTTYKRSCNTCHCKIEKGRKIFSCTLKACSGEEEMTALARDCVVGTDYEIDCYICSCIVVDGEKLQVCEIRPKCWTKLKLTKIRAESLDALNGFCEPRREYMDGCNTCRCMSNAKIVRCTTRPCGARSLEPVDVEIVPFRQAVSKTCPNGHSYKVDCNLCVCLSNGNALCTTLDCSNHQELLK